MQPDPSTPVALYVDAAYHPGYHCAGIGISVKGPSGELMVFRRPVRIDGHLETLTHWSRVNVLEYLGVLAALELVHRWQSRHATIFCDNLTVIRELGNPALENGATAVYRQRAWALMAALPSVQVVGIPRDYNERADALADAARQDIADVAEWRQGGAR